jgi:predicted permease
MKIWSKCQSVFSALWHKDELDRSMDEEMRFHVEMQIKENLESGMAPEQARRSAWRSFGGLEQVKETCRDLRGVARAETLWQDIRFGTRLFLKNPGSTIAAAVALALGIGANTVVFTWIQGTLLDAIPGVENPQRLAVIAPIYRTGGLGENMSIPDIETIAIEQGIFAGVTAFQMGAVPVRLGSASEWLWGQTTLANYFDVLGVRPVLGRAFLPGEDRREAGPGVAVISHSLWRQRFGASTDVLGKVIQVNQRQVTIVGVAPPAFHGTVGGLIFDLWMPLATESGVSDLNSRFEARDRRWLQTIARLSKGVGMSRAQAALDTVGQRLAHDFPKTNKDTTFVALRIWNSPWGGQALFLPVLRVLAVVSGLLLLLVMANTGNLLLARALGRQREIALRLALGSSAGRLTRQWLTEGLLLAALGGTGGLLLAIWGRHALLALMPPSYLPIGYDLRLSTEVFAVTAGLTIIVGLLVGLAPARRSVRIPLNENLQLSGGGSTHSRPQMRLRHALAIGQVALALVLLLGMGLCVRSYSASRKMNLGFDPSGVWLAGFRLNPHAGTDEDARDFFRRLQAEAAGLPGSESAALSSYIPLGIEGIDLTGVKVPGYTPSAGERVNAGIEIVSPGYFKTLRVPLLEGREFTDGDYQKAPMVAVINEAFSKKYFEGRNPIGLTFDTGRGDARIVGIAKTAKYRSLVEPPLPYFYLCTWQLAERNLTLALRTSAQPGQVRRALTRAAVSLDPDAPPHASMSCEDYVRTVFTVQRVAVTLLSALGLLAVLLALMGIYAVVSHNVSQRMKEFGVRMALGARAANIHWSVMRQGVRLILTGVAMGTLIGILVSRLLSDLLVGISAADPCTWLLMPTVLITAVLAACWFPVHRAVTSDPLQSLRYD